MTKQHGNKFVDIRISAKTKKAFLLQCLCSNLT